MSEYVDLFDRAAEHGQVRGPDVVVARARMQLTLPHPARGRAGRRGWQAAAIGAVVLVLAGFVQHRSAAPATVYAGHGNGLAAVPSVVPSGLRLERAALETEVEPADIAGRLTVYDKPGSDGRRVVQVVAVSFSQGAESTALDVFPEDYSGAVPLVGDRAVRFTRPSASTNGLSVLSWTDGGRYRLVTRGFTADESLRLVDQIRLDAQGNPVVEGGVYGLDRILTGRDRSTFGLMSGPRSRLSYVDTAGYRIAVVGQPGPRPTARQILWYFENAELTGDGILRTVNSDGSLAVYVAQPAGLVVVAGPGEVGEQIVTLSRRTRFVSLETWRRSTEQVPRSPEEGVATTIR